jgi:hypothetical protein
MDQPDDRVAARPRRPRGTRLSRAWCPATHAWLPAPTYVSLEAVAGELFHLSARRAAGQWDEVLDAERAMLLAEAEGFMPDQHLMEHESTPPEYTEQAVAMKLLDRARKHRLAAEQRQQRRVFVPAVAPLRSDRQRQQRPRERCGTPRRSATRSGEASGDSPGEPGSQPRLRVAKRRAVLTVAVLARELRS